MDTSTGLPSPRGRHNFQTHCQGAWWQLRSQSCEFQNRSEFSQTPTKSFPSAHTPCTVSRPVPSLREGEEERSGTGQ